MLKTWQLRFLFCFFIQTISIDTINTMSCCRRRPARVLSQQSEQPIGAQAKIRAERAVQQRILKYVDCGLMASAAVIVGGAASLYIAVPDAPLGAQVSIGILGAAVSLYGGYAAYNRWVYERSTRYLTYKQACRVLSVRVMAMDGVRLKRSQSVDLGLIHHRTVFASSRSPVSINPVAVLLSSNDHSVGWRAARPGRTIAPDAGDSVISVRPSDLY